MDIPPKYSPKDVESKQYARWLADGVFAAGVEPARQPYTIVIPPPNVTGILHMGHALNTTIQDVLIRYHRARGFQVCWVPGTDHAGIATQNVVEKALAKERLRKEDIGKEAFLERLWQWRDSYGSTILRQLQTLGAGCEWDRTRFTMDPEYSKAVIEAFVHLHRKGRIYRGNYMINWCPRCKTALSDEEAPHKEIDGWLYYLRYPVISKTGAPEYIVVATTRPETMLGDTAVAIHPDDQRYQALKEAQVILPILNRTLRVVEDDAVDPAFGTGVVKVTPAHDPVDFAMGKKHGLESISIMGEDGVLNEHAGKFRGMDRFKARQAVLDALEREQLIEKKEPYKVSAGHCYRCNTIIEPRMSLQWFVGMGPLAQPAIKAVEDGVITFYPERWKKVYLNWMRSIQDWCISRQIWWGHQIPAWYCRSCNGLHAGACHEAAEPIVAHSKPAQCPRCGCHDLVQDENVLDTWFSSWLWPFAVFYWPFSKDAACGDGARADEQNENQSAQKATSLSRIEQRKKELSYFYPTQTLVTASEILFFWVARMVMAGFEFTGTSPFSHVVIHGTVRDAQGVKMSKSLGNTIDPLAVIDTFGADSLRFSLMMLAAGGSDVYLSDEKFLVGRNFCNKIWNAARFVITKIKDSGFTVPAVDTASMDEIDIWITQSLGNALNRYEDAMASYRINDAAKSMYDFFWHDFCDWYIEIAKDNFTAQRAATTIGILADSMKALHPLMPFITEEVYDLIKAHLSVPLEKTIVLAQWPTVKISEATAGTCAGIEAVMAVVEQLRVIKADLGIPQKRIPVQIRADASCQARWRAYERWVCRLAYLESVEYVDSLSRVIVKSSHGEVDLVVDEADTNQFTAALDKKILQLKPIIERTAAKLANEGFIKKAAADIVEGERSKCAHAQAQLERWVGLKKAFCPLGGNTEEAAHGT